MTKNELITLRSYIEYHEKKFGTMKYTHDVLMIINRELKLKEIEDDITGYGSINRSDKNETK